MITNTLNVILSFVLHQSWHAETKALFAYWFQIVIELMLTDNVIDTT